MPNYNPKKWNKNKYIRSTHNCYTYFLDKIDKDIGNNCKKFNKLKPKNSIIENCKQFKPQPGYYNGYNKIVDKKKYNCEEINRRVKSDNPNIINIKNELDKCPTNYYKGAMVLKPNKMFHFYRQDNNNLWSHKDGHRYATNKDASNNIIKRIKDANRNYVDIHNYNKICNYYCLPKNINKKFMSSEVIDNILSKKTSYNVKEFIKEIILSIKKTIPKYKIYNPLNTNFIISNNIKSKQILLEKPIFNEKKLNNILKKIGKKYNINFKIKKAIGRPSLHFIKLKWISW